MPVTFSDHALQQIKKRNLSKKVITQIVKDPEEIIQSYRGRKLRRKRIDDKILEVVTRTEGTRIIIITAYFLEE